MGYRKVPVRARFHITYPGVSRMEEIIEGGVAWVDDAGTLILATKEYWEEENPRWWNAMALGPSPRIVPFRFFARGEWAECTRLSDG